MKNNHQDKEENGYVQELRSRNLDLTAENLLLIMREPVEDVLTEWGRLNPKSQYHRAIHVLPDIRQKISTVKRLSERAALFHQEDLIRYFMCVHRTVWILEGKPI